MGANYSVCEWSDEGHHGDHEENPFLLRDRENLVNIEWFVIFNVNYRWHHFRGGLAGHSESE